MENEKRLIDANDLRTQFDDIPPYIGLAGSLVQQYIDKAPTVDAVEVVHGRWIVDKNGVVICSECGAEHEWIDYRASFCEDCGAKMDGDGNDI